MAANSVLRVLGTGAFHCGVEVHEREWSYESTGVFCCWPQKCAKHNYFESVPMGDTHLSEIEVFDVIRDLKRAAWGDCYDVLEHNCCHFSDALCRKLGVGGIPTWVTNLALAGVVVRETVNMASCGCCTTLCARATPEQLADPPVEDCVAPAQIVPACSWSDRPDEEQDQDACRNLTALRYHFASAPRARAG